MIPEGDKMYDTDMDGEHSFSLPYPMEKYIWVSGRYIAKPRPDPPGVWYTIDCFNHYKRKREV